MYENEICKPGMCRIRSKSFYFTAHKSDLCLTRINLSVHSDPTYARFTLFWNQSSNTRVRKQEVKNAFKQSVRRSVRKHRISHIHVDPDIFYDLAESTAYARFTVVIENQKCFVGDDYTTYTTTTYPRFSIMRVV